MQVMGHSNPDTFDRAYRSQPVLWDVQNTFLKSNLETDLVELAASTASLTRDPRAPTRLTDEQEYELVSNHPEVVVAREKQTVVKGKCVRKYGSVEFARRLGASEYRDYHDVRNQHHHLKRDLRQEAVKRFRKEYFDNHSFDGSKIQPSIKKLSLPERQILVQLLFTKAETTEAMLKQRQIATENMVRLCTSMEPPRTYGIPKSVKQLAADLTRGKYSLRCDPKVCLFCLGKHGKKSLSTRGRLSRHLEKIHYPSVRGRVFQCPHPICNEMLRHISHFQAHATQVHGIELTKKCGLEFRKGLEVSCEAWQMD